MNYFIYNCFLIFIIIFFAYLNTNYYQEGFIPTIREKYRPYLRNMRIYSEQIYENNKGDISKHFTKFGIM